MRDDGLMQAVLTQARMDMPQACEAQIAQALQGWETHALSDGDAITGVGLTRGSEFHFVLLPGFKFSRQKLREALEPLISRYGFLTTRLLHGDKVNRRFNRLFGFEPTWADKRFQYFMMTALPFER